MSAWVSPLALCRVDEALVQRVARGQRLGTLIASALATTVGGAAMYGAAFGLWRAPEQALYSALKLPGLLVAVALATILANAVLAMLLRADLSLRQSAACVSVALAATAVALGALSPVTAYIALTVTPPDPAALGRTLADPVAAAGHRVSQSLLLMNVTTIAIAGLLGNLRLHSLLRRLIGKRAIAVRVLAAWVLIELLVGSEISWWLRPFLGWPHMPVVFTVADPFSGSFYEEIFGATQHTLGTVGTIALVAWLIALAFLAWLSLRPDGVVIDLEGLDASGLSARASAWRATIAWPEIHQVRLRRTRALFEDGHELVIELRRGPARVILLRFAGEAEASACMSRIEAFRAATRPFGPFRSALNGSTSPSAR